MNEQRIKVNSSEEYVRSVIYGLVHQELNLTESAEELAYVVLHYPSQGIIKRLTKSYMVDHIAVISNLGGGLGLTLGWSIYNFLDYVIDNLL